MCANSKLSQQTGSPQFGPYGAFPVFISFLSPARIRRKTEPCIDCGKCAKACRASLPVNKLISIKSVECAGCLEGLAVCPALSLGLPLLRSKKIRAIPAWAMAVAVLFLGIVGFAKATGHWQSPLPDAAYQVLVPHAVRTAHPMTGQ